MPTVLITINTSWNIWHFRRSLIEALQGKGYRVISAAPDDAHTEALEALVDGHDALPMQNAGTSVWADLRLFIRYVRLLRRRRPDAVLAYTIKPNIYGTLAAAWLGIPVINNVSGLGTVFIKPGLITRVVHALYRMAFRYSACVFFQNPDDRDVFVQRRLVKAEQTALLPGSGVDLQRFQPQPGQSKEAGSPCDFILIARMLRDKGIEEYVEAARQVKAAVPGCRFRLMGPVGVANQTAISSETLEAWQEEGVVEVWPERDDVRDAMAEHDVVVLPSYREGLSRVLLEAAAMGKPLIATDVPGCHHVVQDGVNGLLCEVRSAASLAEAMIRFLRLSASEKAAMGAASRAKAEAEFDEVKVHEAYLGALQRCLRRA